jgi:LPXTG-site transpeptidase (sortase) family protein
MKRALIVFLILAAFIFPRPLYADFFQETPSHVVIPSADISLKVHTAQIIFNTWEVSLDGASFGDGTALPGNRGNTAIFAHARPGLFEELPLVKKGDMIHVFTDLDWFVYRVDETYTVAPERVDILESRNRYEITLYTCVGENYSERFIVKATLLSNPENLHQ